MGHYPSDDDWPTAPTVLDKITGAEFPRLQLLCADNKYHNHGLNAWVAENAEYWVEVVSRPEGKKGWAKLPRRWIVERTFAWLKQCRGLTVGREKSTRSSEAMIRLAVVHLMLRRLHSTNDDAPFSPSENSVPPYGTVN